MPTRKRSVPKWSTRPTKRPARKIPKLTAADLSRVDVSKTDVSKVMSALGKRGGLARAQKLTQAERSAISKFGAAIRYGRLPPPDQEPDST